MNEIRKLSDADIDAYVEIAINAYPGALSAADEEKKKARDRTLKMHRDDPTVTFYGAFRAERLCGGMRLHDFTMTLFAQKVAAGGLGGVAVDLVHKKEKVARDMVVYFLRHYRARGVCLAMLYPFRPDFYRRMGFGYGAKMSQYCVKPESLPRGATKAHIQFLRRADIPAISACYHRYADRTHGMIEKSEFELERVFEKPENRVVGYTEGAAVRGYLVFNFKKDARGRMLVNDMFITELVCETREVRAELLTFLHTQLDQIRYIIFNIQDDYFHYSLLDPRNGSENLIPSVYHESNVQGVGLMYRVLDVLGIFAALREHNFNGQSGKLKLTIADSFLPENAGSVVIHFENGAARLVENGDYETEIRLDIADFSSLIVGAVNFRSLYEYGLADMGDTRYLDTVNKIFAAAPPVCMTHF